MEESGAAEAIPIPVHAARRPSVLAALFMATFGMLLLQALVWGLLYAVRAPD